MTYTIEKVTTLIGARRYGDNDTNIGFILTDSRSLCFPEETLFFALKSERNDGHNYIPELYRRGVKNFVVTNVPKGYASDYPGANFLLNADYSIGTDWSIHGVAGLNVNLAVHRKRWFGCHEL